MPDETLTPETPAGIAPEPTPEPPSNVGQPEPAEDPDARLIAAGFRLVRGAWRRG